MNDNEAAGAAVGIIFASCFVIVYLVVIVAFIAGQWKAFAKAGKPGWAALVPVYNLIVITEIAGKPTWWVILYFVPFANLVVAILTSLAVAKSYGRSEGFGLGLAFLGPIFWPILGFGDSTYIGPMGGEPGGWNGGGGGFGPPPGGGFGPPPGAGGTQPGGWGGTPPSPPSF